MTDTSAPVLRGVVFFHSETGTEGGYWAFMDTQFSTVNTTSFACVHCGLYWNKEQETEEAALAKAQETNMEKCLHNFQLTSPVMWSYEGLHILKDGDRLKIFAKDNSSVMEWEGTITLLRHPSFTQDAKGMWIHADQVGVERDLWASWFFAENPAELVLA